MKTYLNKIFVKKNIAFLCLIFLFYSCSNTAKHKENRTVFRYNESSGITSLDPAFAKDQANIWADNQIFNGLVQLDENLNIIPCIAKKWSISDKGLKYTFYLRDDVFFHANNKIFKKGRRVVASDFEYSFKRLVDKKLASPGAWVFNNVYKNNDVFSFDAINDTCFVIRLKQAFPPFLGILTMQYCSVIPHEAVEFFGKDFSRNPVGTGPFYLKLWEEDVKMVLLKNDNYFEYFDNKRLPFLDAVAISFVIDKQIVFLEFVKGKLDFMSGIAPDYKDELLSRSGKLNTKYKDKINMVSMPYLNTEYLGILVDTSLEIVKNNPLKIKAVRQAVNYGFDRKKMIKYLRNNIGTPGIYGIIPLGLPSFDTSKMIGYKYNPAKAEKLLLNSGFKSIDEIPEITLSTTSSYVDLCQYIQHQLNSLGLKINIEVNPPATLREMISQNKMEFFRGSWIADYPDAENYLSLFYSENFCPKGPNYTHFANKKFDSLYLKAQNTHNDSLRFDYYIKMNNLVMQEAAVVILYYDRVLRFTQKNIFDLGVNPLNLLTLKKTRKLNQ